MTGARRRVYVSAVRQNTTNCSPIYGTLRTHWDGRSQSILNQPVRVLGRRRLDITSLENLTQTGEYDIMDSDSDAIKERLSRLETALNDIRKDLRKLRLYRRQVILQEVGEHEKALGMEPTTAELRERGKKRSV